MSKHETGPKGDLELVTWPSEYVSYVYVLGKMPAERLYVAKL